MGCAVLIWYQNEYVKNISEDISEDLKIKTSDYLCENQNYFSNLDVVEDSSEDKKEDFLREILWLLFLFFEKMNQFYI